MNNELGEVWTFWWKLPQRALRESYSPWPPRLKQNNTCQARCLYRSLPVQGVLAGSEEAGPQEPEWQWEQHSPSELNIQHASKGKLVTLFHQHRRYSIRHQQHCEKQGFVLQRCLKALADVLLNCSVQSLKKMRLSESHILLGDLECLVQCLSTVCTGRKGKEGREWLLFPDILRFDKRKCSLPAKTHCYVRMLSLDQCLTVAQEFRTLYSLNFDKDRWFALAQILRIPI